MRDKIIEWSGTVPDDYRGILFLDKPDPWLRTLNKQLDREFLGLVEANKGKL